MILDSGSGTTIVDSLNRYNLTSNSSTWVTGKVGFYGMNFTKSSSQYATSLANLSELHNVNFTVNGWIKLQSLATGTNTEAIYKIGSDVNTADSNTGAQVWINVDVAPNKWISVIPNQLVAGSNISGDVGTYTMITMRYDHNNNNLTTWRNGILDSTVRPSGDWVGSGDFWIGRSLQGSFINMAVDEIGIWNRTLNATEINDLYNSSNGLAFSVSQPPLNVTTFENVYVSNNLTVINNVSASKGFFTNLGSLISRITKGWFTDLDVFGTTNLTGQTYIKNASCSAGQVLTTDSSTGLVSCANKADVKSGSASVTEGTCSSITFNTAFSNTPAVTGNAINTSENNIITIGSPSTSGFNLCMNQQGSASSYTVYWIATNAGNP